MKLVSYMKLKLTQEIKVKGSLKTQYNVCLVLIPCLPQIKMIPRFLIALFHGIQKNSTRNRYGNRYIRKHSAFTWL